MTKSFLRLSLAAALASVSTAALSADLTPPPPEELRPAAYDWSGPYVGAFAAGIFVEGHYSAKPLCDDTICMPGDPEMSGDGFAGGVLAGWNVDLGGFVLGVEGDWGWGGQVAQNRSPEEDTSLAFDSIATIRGRAGVVFDDTTLVYVTGGAAFADASFEGKVGDPHFTRLTEEDSDWMTGWVIGAGMEHAFADYLHGRIEYLFADFSNNDFDLSTGDPSNPGGSVKMDFDGVHMVRAALTFNFGNFGW